VQLSSEDLAEVEEALETLGTKQRRLLIEEQELLDIKDELRDYQEDIEDFKQVRPSISCGQNLDFGARSFRFLIHVTVRKV
jgi:LETM1 and EF-hand domain-containing protein 1